MNVLDFPNEIQEQILSYLGIEHLIAATRSCPLWKAIANRRLLKQWCVANISSDILLELSQELDENHAQEHDWQDLCVRWSTNVSSTRLPLDSQLTRVAGSRTHYEIELQPNSTICAPCNCVALSGERLVTTQPAGHLVWYDRFGAELTRVSNGGRPITGIGLLRIGSDRKPVSEPSVTNDQCRKMTADEDSDHDAVVVLCADSLAIYSTPEASCTNEEWICSKLYESVNKSDGCGDLISILGRNFAHSDRAGKRVTVSQVKLALESSNWDSFETPPSGRSSPRVHVERMHQFSSEHRVLNCKLWRGRLICLLQNGTVVSHHLADGQTVHSSIVSDLRYPFESSLYRGLIFCNITTERTLLNYWHISMGLPHWLVSADGRRFKRVSTNFPSDDEITTVVVRGTVIVTGTLGGRLCFYCFKGEDAIIPDFHFENPLLICRLPGGAPIYQCDFSSRGDRFLVFVKTHSKTLMLVTLPTVENYQTEQNIFTTNPFINP